MLDVLIAATPPIVTKILAATGVWLRSRSRTQRPARRVEAAPSRIAAITSVLAVYAGDPTRDHDEAKQEVLRDLDVAYREMHVAEATARRETARGGVASLTRAVLLLDQQASTIVAKSALAVVLHLVARMAARS